MEQIAMLTVDMGENIRSIGRLASLNPNIICFGHGKPLQENTADLLHRFAKKWLPSAPWPQYVP